MLHDKNQTKNNRSSILGFRLDAEERTLVVEAADREGLGISGFIILLLIRAKVLPESCMKKLRRRPMPLYNALHELLGVVNKIGGNCKQLSRVVEDVDGLSEAHACLIQAAAIITDALLGVPVPDGVNLYRLQGNITEIGHRFNLIVKSVNTGRPNLVRLPETLSLIGKYADDISIALASNPIRPVIKAKNHPIAEKIEVPAKPALEDVRLNMKRAAKRSNPPKGQ